MEAINENTVWMIPWFVYFVGIEFVGSVFACLLKCFWIGNFTAGRDKLSWFECNYVYTHKICEIVGVYRCMCVCVSWFSSVRLCMCIFVLLLRLVLIHSGFLFELNGLCTNKIGMAVIFIVTCMNAAFFFVIQVIRTNIGAQWWHIVLESWFDVYSCILMLCYVPWKCNKFWAMEMISSQNIDDFEPIKLIDIEVWYFRLTPFIKIFLIRQ